MPLTNALGKQEKTESHINSITLYRSKNNDNGKKFLDKNVANNADNFESLNLLEFNKSDYILGTGDKLKILFYEPENLTNIFEIMANGRAKIPFIGQFQLNNLTLSQAKKVIKKELQKDMIEPYFDIILEEPRPIKITLIGQVESPGLYTLPYKLNIPNNKAEEIENSVTSFKYHPTIVDLLKISGGVNHDSDFADIEVIRKFKYKNDVIKKKTKVSLLDLFLRGKTENNIFLYDGDIIKIKKSETLDSNSFKIIRANLMPKSIPIFVVGEVQKPGKYEVPINTSLVDAVLISGGPLNSRSNKSKVILQRILKDGEVSRSFYKINYSSNRSKNSNPIVKKNDIIFVQSTTLAKVSDKLNIIASPVTNILSIYTLFKVIED